MNTLITLLKCVLSRAELVMYLQSVNLNTNSNFPLDEIILAVNVSEIKRVKLEDLTHNQLESTIFEEGHIGHIKGTVMKVINILNNYLNTRGCRPDEDKKLQRQMYSMSIPRILQQFTQQSIIILNEQLSLLKSKKQPIVRSFFSNGQISVLTDLVQLQCRYLLIPTHIYMNSYFQTHLIWWLQVEFTEQQIIYSWLIKTFRICQQHIDEKNMKVDTQDERFVMVIDFITKRSDALYRDLLDRNSFINGQIQKHINNSSKKLEKSMQRDPKISLVYYTQYQNKGFQIKKINTDASRIQSLFLENTTSVQQKNVMRKIFLQVNNFEISTSQPHTTQSQQRIKDNSIIQKVYHQGSPKRHPHIVRRDNLFNFLEIPLNSPQLSVDTIVAKKTIKQRQILPSSISNIFVDSSIKNNYLNQFETKFSKFYSERSQSNKNATPIQAQSPLRIKSEINVSKSLNLLKFHIFKIGKNPHK